MRELGSVRKLPRPALAVLWVALLAGVAAGDYWTGPFLILDLFYLLPVLLMTWYVGRGWGALLAVLGSAVWVAMQIASGHPLVHPLMWAWNLAVRSAVSLIMVALLSALQRRTQDQQRLIGELQRAARQIRQLKGLLPICAWCKNIRDDAGYWRKLEQYVQDHSEATFTHGICPECSHRLIEQSKRKADG